jgi:alpha-D-xyloside xylohydrolase
MSIPEEYQYVKNLISYEREDNCVIFNCKTDKDKSVVVKLDLCASNLVRLRMFPMGKAEERASYLLLKETWPHVAFEVEEKPDSVLVKTASLIVRVQKSPWELAFLDKDRNPLCRENPADVNVQGKIKVKPLGYTPAGDSGVKSVCETMLLASDEHFYGFGEKFIGLDKRGQQLVSWTVDAYGCSTERSYKNIPFFMSTKGYGIFINSTFKIFYDMGADSCVSYSFEVMDSILDFFFIYGPAFKDILRKYTEITGRAPVPPKWSFGLWMSSSFIETSYKNRKELEAFCDKVRREDIPCDVVHLDPLWMEMGNYCDFVWDSKAFPNPKEMMTNLEKKGFKVCLWENPYVSSQSKVFKECEGKGYFLKKADGSTYISDVWGGLYPPTGIIDFTNPEAVEWYQEQHKSLIEIGAATFKTDFGEAVPEDAIFHNGKTGAEMHNVYPLLYNRTVFTAIEKYTNGKAVVWGRSAYAGSQQYPTHWSGDSACTFETMACVMRSGLSYGLSGVPFWSHDIGGFGAFGTTKPTPELYVRWAQLGLFSSHSRCHGMSRREPWAFGDEAVKIFRSYAKLRYRLLPYIYSYAHVASHTGLPTLRAMILEYQDDSNTFDKDLQYMFGSELLVAPICDESSSKEVYLPKGKWIDYWNKKEYEGPKTINYRAPLNILPLFVRENSIIPMGPQISYVGEKPTDPVTLDIYVSEKAEFKLYDDEEIINMNCTRSKNNISLTISKSKRTYIANFNKTERAKLVHVNSKKLMKYAQKRRFEKAAEGWMSLKEKVMVKFVAHGEIALRVALK